MDRQLCIGWHLLPLHSVCCGHLVALQCANVCELQLFLPLVQKPSLFVGVTSLIQKPKIHVHPLKHYPRPQAQSIAVFKHSTIWTWFLYFKNTKVDVNVVEEKLAYSFGSYSLEPVGIRRISPTEWTGFLQQSLISWLGLEYILSFIICFRQ